MADGLDAGVATESAWIIRRARLESERMPRYAEQLELRTWCAGTAKSAFERRTSLSGDDGARIEVEAIWVHVDPANRRPTRLPTDLVAVYAESAGGHRARTSLRHPADPPDDAEQIEWRFARADIDLAGHVNNTMYWRVAEEHLELAPPADGPGVLEAEYRSGIGPGPAIVRRSDGMLWICDLEGIVAATLSVAPLP